MQPMTPATADMIPATTDTTPAATGMTPATADMTPATTAFDVTDSTDSVHANAFSTTDPYLNAENQPVNSVDGLYVNNVDDLDKTTAQRLARARV